MGDVARYSDEELLPISALQHLLFCERQCALIHVEGVWRENRQTAEGRVLHDRAHGGVGATTGGLRIARSLPLASHRLGLGGVADIVEFHADGRIVPVEYKRGRPKRSSMDRVQLCAQAMCLEEMVERPVQEGALYYASTRKRLRVELVAELRQETSEAVERLRSIIAGRHTPRGVFEKKCLRCSLLPDCLPRTTAAGAVRQRFERDLLRALSERPADT